MVSNTSTLFDAFIYWMPETDITLPRNICLNVKTIEIHI